MKIRHVVKAFKEVYLKRRESPLGNAVTLKHISQLITIKETRFKNLIAISPNECVYNDTIYDEYDCLN